MNFRSVFAAVALAGLTSGLAQAQAPARPVPPARITRFAANPATEVQPGAAVQLVWNVENPTSTTIEPELGRVAARGARVVRPKATTSYKLTVNGPNNQVLTQEVIVKVAGSEALPTSTAPAAAIPKDPRMPDGKPDLNGVYNFAGVRNAQPPPLKPGAEKYRVVRGQPGDAKGNTTLSQDCVPLGIPQVFVTPYPFQIVQTPKMITMIFEYPNTFRFIPLDGRPHTPDPDPSWNGEAVGRWDGDTLVVDTIGFNGRTEVSGFIPTESLHVVERYKRMENGNLQYDVTVEDPNVWTTPWVMPQRTFALRPEAEHVDEFVCEQHVDYSKYFDTKK